MRSKHISCLQLVYLLFISGLKINLGPALTATQLPLQLVDFSTIEFLPVRDDRHCFIYVLRESNLSHLRIHISEEFISKRIFNEFEINFLNYLSFTSKSREIFFVLLKRYFNNKVYNSNAADLLPVVVFNAFHKNVIVAQHGSNSLNACSKITSFNSTSQANESLAYVILHFNNEHYSGTKFAAHSNHAHVDILPIANCNEDLISKDDIFHQAAISPNVNTMQSRTLTNNPLDNAQHLNCHHRQHQFCLKATYLQKLKLIQNRSMHYPWRTPQVH